MLVMGKMAWREREREKERERSSMRVYHSHCVCSLLIIIIIMYLLGEGIPRIDEPVLLCYQVSPQ